MGRLRVARRLLSCVLCYGAAFAQTATSSGAPPKVLLLVSQQMLPGKAGERDKFELETCRKFDEFGIPIPWIEMEAVTGEPGALFFDPANSFEEMERAGQLLSEAYGAHPELAQLQDEIEARLASSKNILAVLRDDLGSGRDRIDLSKAHYLRITTISVRPGHESDFEEAEKVRSRSPTNAAWAVYEVDSGAATPTFFEIEALRSLVDMDRKLTSKGTGEKERRHLEQTVHDTYATVESNLYAIHPEMSHVSRGFAAGDQEFWGRK